MKLTQTPQLRRALSAIFSLLSIGFFIFYAGTNFDEIPQLRWNFTSVAVAFISTALIVFNILLAGTIWFLLLRAGNAAPSWIQSQTVISISQFGKYLPGNVGQHLGRIVMARDLGIPLPIIFSTLLIETLWNAGICAGLALLSLLTLGAERTMGVQLHIGPPSLAVAMVVLLLFPWLSIGFLNRAFPGFILRVFKQDSIAPPQPLIALTVAALFLLSFISMGLILKLQAEFFWGVPKGDVLELTGLFALAWLAGFIAPGAPAGLGVREAMMVLLLSPVLGAGAAVGLSVTLRLTTTLGDALAFALGLLGKKLMDGKKNV